jgi:hypothetical protein
MVMMEADPILPVREHNQDDTNGFIRMNALRPAKRDHGEGAEKK